MAIKIKDGYKCGYCSKPYKTSGEADKCKEDHNLVYVALSKEDLNRLMNFIYLKEDKLLGETLVNTLNKYMKGMKLLELTKKDLDKWD